MSVYTSLDKELVDQSNTLLDLQRELEDTNQGILLLALELEQEKEELMCRHREAVRRLQDKVRENQENVRQLQEELDITNHGILLLAMELEQDKENRYRENAAAIQQLQKELEVTNQGLIALTCELDQANEKYRNIVEYANNAIFTVNEERIIETANRVSLALFGYHEDELIGKNITQLLPNFVSLQQTAAVHNGKGQCISCLAIKSNGLSFPVEISFGESRLTNKVTLIVLVNDITERVRIEQGMRLMVRVFEDSYDAIIITDTQGNIVNVNASFLEISGYSRDEVVGKHSRILKSQRHGADFYAAMWQSITTSGCWRGEIWDKRKNGEVYPKWLSISAVKDSNGVPVNYVGIFADITSRVEAEHRLRQLAHYDQLTGLPNRTLFLEKLNWAMEMATRNKNNLALFFLDLDRFKIINDTLGHQAGDQLLCEVAQRLRKVVRKVDTVARLAGDEFTVIIGEVKNTDEVDGVAEKILNCFASPVVLDGREIFITTSVGITYYPMDGNNVDSLLKNADTAMYHAKSLGKNRYQFFSDFMNRKVHEELELEINLRKAIDNREFALHYQPQYSLKTDEIVGVEVLIRWRHPELGEVSPATFIPYAEKIDMIIPIGSWVLKTACEEFCRWRSEGIPIKRISVNYSGSQLKNPDQIGIISNILEETGMDPACLNLELTETVIMENAEDTIRALRDIKNMGISISVDDFGTGYSSLSYLKRFPIDTLKIDKSFVQDITTDADDEAIATTIIAMAHALRLSVLAEGVETEDQLSMLRAKNCDEIQGYYLCRPLPPEEVRRFMQYHSPGLSAEPARVA